MRRIACSCAVLGYLLHGSAAFGWYKHAVLMPWLARGLPPEVREALAKSHSAPCPDKDHAMLARLAAELSLNPSAELVATAERECANHAPISLADALLDGFVDDPDGGMDRDLDLSPDQAYMGGTKGPGSQGFRHMYFAGWSASRPLAIFQFPPRAMGIAPERARLMAEKARQLYRQGDRVWGARVAAWALHYIQDLAQPFHSAQIPNLRMIRPRLPLVASATRSITNYHWAYEGYVLHRFKTSPTPALGRCLEEPTVFSKLELADGVDPRAIALEVARAARARAWELGSACVDFFGTRLREPECDLTSGKCSPDYKELVSSSSAAPARDRLDQLTCEALADAARASAAVLRWWLAH